MSPVHSIAAPDLSIRHHHVSPTPETLFPECPDDLSPQQVAGSLVPLAGQHGSNADRATPDCPPAPVATDRDRKSTRLNSSHSQISYAVFCLKKKRISVGLRRPGASCSHEPSVPGAWAR